MMEVAQLVAQHVRHASCVEQALCRLTGALACAGALWCAVFGPQQLLMPTASLLQDIAVAKEHA